MVKYIYNSLLLQVFTHTYIYEIYKHKYITKIKSTLQHNGKNFELRLLEV